LKICLKDTLFKLLFKNKKLISKRDTSLEISNSNGNVQFDEDSSKKIFKYQRYDNIKIDNNFKYYHKKSARGCNFRALFAIKIFTIQK